MMSTIAMVQNESPIDRRIWPMLCLVGLFAVLVMKEVSLPPGVILVIGAVGLLALLVVGLRSPEIPLYILVAYLPFSRILVGDFGTQATALNLTNILTIWVLVAYLLRQTGRGKSLFQGTPLNRMILMFAFLGAISLIRTGWTYGSWYVFELITPLKRWLTPVFFYFLTLWVVRDKVTWKTIIVLITVTVTIVAMMASWDYLTLGGASFERSRIGGIAQQPNTLGAFFDYYMFLIAGFFLVYPKRFKTWLLVVPFLICFRGIMVTFSRGAYLAFAAGCLTASFSRHKLLFVLTVGLLAFAVVNPWLLPAGVRYRMGMTVQRSAEGIVHENLEQSLDASAAHRLEIWRGGLEMVKANPWWGVGYGAFPRLLSYYTGGQVPGADAHNSYLLIAAEMGIPTLLVFLLVLVIVIYYTRWLYRRTSDLFFKATALGYLAGLFALLVANMFGSRIDSQEVSSYFWILAALIMRAVLMEREGIKQQATRNKRHVRKVRTQFA